jgi:hypothetical protein
MIFLGETVLQVRHPCVMDCIISRVQIRYGSDVLRTLTVTRQ